ncbi:MAG: hypothetical protein IT438_15200 [Phycisphaerales bacterium]|nr:hypothetical protein [Phycisphaerales bacterium]
MRFISRVRGGSALAAVAWVASGAFAQGATLIAKLNVEPKTSPTKINVNPIGEPEPGGGQEPEAIVRIVSATLRIQDPVPFGLAVTRGNLGPDRAYGLGLPNGYDAPPPNNSAGPWVGLMWPFRDFNDGYAPSTPPAIPGNSVGEFESGGAAAGTYFVRNMVGAMAFDINDPTTYERGVFTDTGRDPRFFKVELESLVDIGREVSVTLSDLRAVVLLRDEFGNLRTQELAAPSVTISIFIPAPGAVGLMAMGGLLATRRARR